MKKKLWIPLVTFVLAAAVGWVVVRRSAGATDGFRFVEVTRGSLESTVSATGNLEAIETIEVGTQVSGRIAEIFVDFNDRVTAGQLIARIDPTLLEQEVLANEASLERSQADTQEAKREYDRQDALFRQALAAESDYQTAQYRYQVALAAEKLATANLARARYNLAYTEIRAPVDGVVIERNVEVGQTVAASLAAPTLFVLARDLSQMQILTSVDESDIGKVHQDQEVHFTVQAYADTTFSGHVRQVRLQSSNQENVVSYTVVINFENRGGLLLPGMTATTEFVVERAKDVLVVSNAALRFQPTEEMRERILPPQRPTAADRDDPPDGSPDGSPGGSPDGIPGGTPDDSPDGSLQESPAETGSERPPTPPANLSLLWRLDEDGRLEAIPVRKGISDGQTTVVSAPGLEEGTRVIAAHTGGSSGSSTEATTSNPFQSQRGSMGPPPGPGM